MRGDLRLRERGVLTGLDPPLAGEGDEADEHLAVERGGVRVEAAPFELGTEEPLDAAGDAGEDRREGAARTDITTASSSTPSRAASSPSTRLAMPDRIVVNVPPVE